MNGQAPAPLGLRNVLLLLMVAFAWGSNNVGAHIVTQQVQPLLAAGVRFGLTALLLAPWLRIPRMQLRHMIVLGLFGGPVHFSLLYSGFAASHNVGALTVVMQMWVPISTLLAIVLLHEYPTRAQLIGLVCAFAGMLIMCFDPHLVDDWRAALLCFSATACWGVTMVLTRKWAGLHGVSIQAWMALLSTPVLLLGGWLLAPDPLGMLKGARASFWLLTVYGIVAASLLGNVVVFSIVRKFPVAQTTPVLLTGPFFALVCGMLFTGEKLGAQELLGAVIVLAGVLFIVRARGSA